MRRTVLFLLLILASPGCDDEGPTDPLGVGGDDLAVGEAAWVGGDGDRFDAQASLEHLPATDEREAWTIITLTADQPGDAEDLTVRITMPEILESGLRTDETCDLMISLTGYPRPIDGGQLSWWSCCGLPRVECAENDTRCQILEVEDGRVRGEFRATLYYFSGFRLWGTTTIRGVFHAVAPEQAP